jgi:hypothetical protein
MSEKAEKKVSVLNTFVTGAKPLAPETKKKRWQAYMAASKRRDEAEKAFEASKQAQSDAAKLFIVGDAAMQGNGSREIQYGSARYAPSAAKAPEGGEPTYFFRVIMVDTDKLD